MISPPHTTGGVLSFIYYYNQYYQTVVLPSTPIDAVFLSDPISAASLRVPISAVLPSVLIYAAFPSVLSHDILQASFFMRCCKRPDLCDIFKRPIYAVSPGVPIHVVLKMSRFLRYWKCTDFCGTSRLSGVPRPTTNNQCRDFKSFDFLWCSIF